MRWLATLLLAFTAGFISLSYEVLWARLFSWATAGAASSFPMLLGLFLTGIAVGARWSKRFTKGKPTYSPGALRALAVFTAGSAIAGWLVIPAMAWLLSSINVPGFTALYFVFGAACLFGAQLPLLMHFGIEADQRVGARLSNVYVANVIGAVGGSLVTGFLWLDQARTPEIVTILTLAGLVVSFLLVLGTRPAKATLVKAIAGLSALGVLVVLASPSVYSSHLERLYYSGTFEGQEFKTVLENKSGYIAVDQEDVAIGGGVYDGEFSLDLVEDRNGVARAYSLSAFHPNPKKVLVIGMATGSWARVVAENPNVEEVVIVEINPGYYELVKLYPQSAALLTHPKVRIVSDDARRWLNTTDETFDFIVSNSSFHVRGFASTLLSREFMDLAREHLNPGGFLLFNTTGSKRALATAVDAFPHVSAYLRSAVCSNDPIVPDAKRYRETILSYRIDGKKVIDPESPEDLERLTLLTDELREQNGNYFSEDRVSEVVKDEEIITDDNMGHEWTFDLFGMIGD